MTWGDFAYFAVPAVCMWLLSGMLVYAKPARRWSGLLMMAGTLTLFVFIKLFWIQF
jgi:hypothetical protein